MSSDAVTCPECDEGFETEADLREHFFDSHLRTRSEATHTDDHDEQSAETSTRTRTLVYGTVGAAVLAGLLGGVVAISDYYFVPPNPTDDLWLSVVVYGGGVAVIILLFVIILTNMGALRNEM